MQTWRSVTDVVTAEHMIRQLAGMCNGAATWDSAGFSKTDVHFGHSLAQHAAQGRAWSEKQATAALKMITKYSRQLGGKEEIRDWMQAPNFAVMPQTATPSKEIRTLSSVDSQAVFQFKFNPDLVKQIKQIRGEHKGARFWASWHADTKSWRVSVNESSIHVIMTVAREWEFDIEERFETYYSRVVEKWAHVAPAAEESRVAQALGMHMGVHVESGVIHIYHDQPHVLSQFEQVMQSCEEMNHD